MTDITENRNHEFDKAAQLMTEHFTREECLAIQAFIHAICAKRESINFDGLIFPLIQKAAGHITDEH